MLIPRGLWCFALALGLSAQLAAGFAQTSGKFDASEPTNIPGLTLNPGSYSIHVVDHLSERYVIRVDGPGHGIHYTFLALENSEIPKPASPGLVTWNHAPDGKEYARGWLFPGSPAVLEFVYPKAEAVTIAKSNEAKVPAIDPASEGRAPRIKGLSKSDLELVTLWLLSSTRVGPGDSAGGIQAERYPEVAKPERKPVVARLPQTGSNLPLIAWLSAFSFLTAFAIRRFRVTAAEPARNSSWRKSRT